MSERQSPPADARARERAVHDPGSVLVQAPAGSGKTTLLTQRYLRLLSEVDQPERILALTFTRRAALEMRARVSAALTAAAESTCPSDQNPTTWQLAVAAARHLATLGIDPVQHPARLRIETIDAFNAWLAGQLPIGAGTGGVLHMQTDGAAYELAARRCLGYAEADAFGAAVEVVLGLGDQNWARLVELLAGMLPGRDRWLPILAGSLAPSAAASPEHLREVRRQFDADLAALVGRGLDRAARALGAARLTALSQILHGAAHAATEPPPNLAAWYADGSALGTAPAELPRWQELLGILLRADGGLRAQVTTREGFPRQSAHKAPLVALLAELAGDTQLAAALKAARALPEPRYGDAQWEGVRAVTHVLLLAAAELENVFRERGAADFPAVAMAARRALGTALQPTDLALRLDYRLHHILVDEFQDTSGAQLELLQLLTAGWLPDDGRSIFCVGDPMQSIYGFREAEVRAFLQLADTGIGQVRFDVQRLQSNFRAATAVVDWVNATFSRILPRRDDRERGAIAYRPSISAAAIEDADTGVDIAAFESRGAEAQALAAVIVAARRDHPDWRIAILVRARRHAELLASALRKAGVSYRAIDMEPLQSRHVIRDLLSLTRALLHFGDRTAWLAVLRAPWIGLTLADLLVIARAAGNICDALVDGGVQAQLSDDARDRCLRLHGIIAAAQRCRGQTSLARWIERCWLALGGPACAEAAVDLDHLGAAFERLRVLEDGGLPDVSALEAAFADLYARDPAASAVEIMTIHKAKGLEFDLVVVPALERSISGRGDDILVMREFAAADRDAMVMAAKPAVGDDDRRLFRFLQGAAREAAALEAERLLYVACTRAKSRLHLSAVIGAAAVEEAADETEDGTTTRAGEFRPRSGSLLQVVWPVLGPAFTSSSSGERIAAAAAPEEGGLGGGALRRVPAGWVPAALPAPFALPSAVLGSVSQEPAPVFDWAGETARRVGTLVHAELQTLVIAAGGAARIEARAPHYRRWLQVHGVPDERLGEAVGRVIGALTAVQGDARGRWILAPGHREEVREYALSGAFRGAVARAVFDRSFIDASGVRWVIDYKTSEHEGGGVDAFLEREVDRYRPQMQRYAEFARRLGPEPVRVGLYFPLMRAWREWDPEP